MPKTLINNFNYNVATSGLLIMMLFLGMAYIYLVNASVFLVNQRREAEDKITQVGADLSTMETAYLTQMNQMDLAFAETQGFVEAPKDSTFVYRDKVATGVGFSLSR